MSGRNSDLTLEGLARRLETLERENEALRNEVAELRGSGARAGGELVADADGQVSRRALLRNAGAAAVAAVAAGTLLSAREAKADHFDPGINVDFVNAHSSGVAITGTGVLGVQGRSDSPNSWGVLGRNNNSSGIGVRGASTDGVGIQGEGGQFGVKGFGPAGVYGESSTNQRGAVEGSNDSGEGYGVWGNATFAGVRGTGGTFGVVGGTNNTTAAGAGVSGFHQGLGPGTSGGSNNGPGVEGRSHGGSRGAVEGRHFANGYGGQFIGGKAQLRLAPKGTAGRPTTGVHAKGEIYMDSEGTLFVCTEGGTAPTWRRVNTTLVT